MTDKIDETAPNAPAQVTESGVQPSVEPDLDAILAEFDTPQDAPTETPAAEPAEDTSEARLARLEQRTDAQETEAEIERIAQVAELPANVLEPYLLGKVQKDPRLQGAWRSRSTNPEAWNKVRDALATEAKGLFRAPDVDTTATDDQDAMVAAVRGASASQTQPAGDDENVAGMNAQQWQDHQKKHGVKPFGT